MSNKSEFNFVPVVISIAIVLGIISFIVVVSDQVNLRVPMSIEGK